MEPQAARILKGRRHVYGHVVVRAAPSECDDSMPVFLCGRFRQQEAQSESEGEHGTAHDGGCLGHEHGRRVSESAREERGPEGHGRANHPTAYIRCEAPARGPQVDREHLRQVFAHVAKLGHRQKAGHKDAPLKELGLLVEEPQVGQRQNDEAGYLEKPEECASANGNGQHERQSDTASKPTEFLPELDILTPSLHHGISDLLFRSIGTELCQNLLSIDHGLLCRGYVAGESCQFRIQIRELIGQC